METEAVEDAPPDVRDEWVEKDACPDCGGDVQVYTCNDLIAKYCVNGDCRWVL